jgi:pimeloyl-ACP methyl ester carboxylesterase
LAAFAALTMPVLYMMGGRSPESAHAVARRLVPVLPRVTVQTFEDLGHMAPVTDANTINAAIVEFLKQTDVLLGE